MLKAGEVGAEAICIKSKKGYRLRSGMEKKELKSVDEEDFMLFLAYRSMFVSYPTIKGDLCAIKHTFVMHFRFDPFVVDGEPMLLLGKLVRQLKLLDCDRQRAVKLSVTTDVLRKIKCFLD